MAIPAFSMHTVQTGTDDLPRKLEVMQVYDRMQAKFPGGEIPAVVAIKAKDVTTPQIASAVKELEQRAVATGHFNAPVDVVVSPDKHVALIDVPMNGNGTDDQSVAALADLRGGIVADDGGQRARRRERVRVGHGRAVAGLERPHEGAGADRVRLRPHAGLHPAAGHLPLDRHPDQGDRPQPAVGGRRLRRPRLGLPGRPPRGPARLRVQRRGHELAADVPVRDPVRAVDGLPRVHPQPRPRGVRSRDVDRGRGRRTASRRRQAR